MKFHRLFILSVISLFFCSVSHSKEPEKIKLLNQGTEDIIDYFKYGSFNNSGSENYSYKVTDRIGLSEAAGTGVYPNFSVQKSAEYQALLKSKKLDGSHWNFLDTKNHKINFYKWLTAQENTGVKQYYIAFMFEKMGMHKEAVKAYYSLIVNFPKTFGMTYWNSPWYMGPNAIDKIHFITRNHPELGLKLVGAKIAIKNSFNLATKDDIFVVNPGRLVKVKLKDVVDKPVNVEQLKIIKTCGGLNTKVVQYENGHWRLFVKDKPYIIKGMAYQPNKTGLSPDRGTLNATRDWQTADYNNNGVIDGPYEAWVDKNWNNSQDKNEPVVGDFQLLKDMGCNTLRIYDHIINKELFRDLWKNYGIMAVVGDLLGVYAVGSGATWEQGTDYENKDQQDRMLSNVRQMVLDNKDEPYVLFWLLGNENVYGVGNNSAKKPEAFFKFLNKAAKLIHELDPSRPVAISNGDLKFLEIIAANCPDIDIFGCNAYRGKFGFGTSFFENVKDLLNKPVIVTEYGCSAIGEGYTEKESFEFQKDYFKYNWLDLIYNSAGRGVGNSLGGFAFEFTDEWWKANSDLPLTIQLQKKQWYSERSAVYKNLQPETHDHVPQFGAPFVDGWSYEEWYGIFAQGDGKNSPFLRQKRPVYDMYKEIWK